MDMDERHDPLGRSVVGEAQALGAFLDAMAATELSDSEVLRTASTECAKVEGHYKSQARFDAASSLRKCWDDAWHPLQELMVKKLPRDVQSAGDQWIKSLGTYTKALDNQVSNFHLNDSQLMAWDVFKAYMGQAGRYWKRGRYNDAFRAVNDAEHQIRPVMDELWRNAEDGRSRTE